MSDWVMINVNAIYNPEEFVENFGNFQMVELAQTAPEVEVILEGTIPQSVCDVIAVAGCWEALAEEEQHMHLCAAFMRNIHN